LNDWIDIDQPFIFGFSIGQLIWLINSWHAELVLKQISSHGQDWPAAISLSQRRRNLGIAGTTDGTYRERLLRVPMEMALIRREDSRDYRDCDIELWKARMWVSGKIIEFEREASIGENI
jgi:hypothetical protein